MGREKLIGQRYVRALADHSDYGERRIRLCGKVYSACLIRRVTSEERKLIRESPLCCAGSEVWLTLEFETRRRKTDLMRRDSMHRFR